MHALERPRTNLQALSGKWVRKDEVADAHIDVMGKDQYALYEGSLFPRIRICLVLQVSDSNDLQRTLVLQTVPSS